jgi:hypothetical protein
MHISYWASKGIKKRLVAPENATAEFIIVVACEQGHAMATEVSK